MRTERYCFLTFLLEGKFRKYDTSMKRIHAKTNKKMIFCFFFTNVCKTKILFFMQCMISNFTHKSIRFYKTVYHKQYVVPLWELSQYSFVPQDAKMQVRIAAVKATMNSAIARDNNIPLKTFLFS